MTAQVAEAPDFAGEAFPDLDSVLSQPDVAFFGIQPARKEEIQKADALLAAAPSGAAPLDTFRYLAALTDANADGERYNAGWKTRWNPVIVRFFTATNFGKPSGDTTSWCAASLNWSLKRGGFNHGTGSAASASFRDAPGRTDAPAPGDVVVFVQTADHAHGHVALFLAQDADRIQCIGGNQTDVNGHHAVCVKWIPKKGFLTFHSFHSVAALR
jgi:uncharacterized protein (TIGR02594 family)